MKCKREVFAEAKKIVSETDFDGIDVFCENTITMYMLIPPHLISHTQNYTDTHCCQYENVYMCRNENECTKKCHIGYIRGKNREKLYAKIGDYLFIENGETFIVPEKEFEKQYQIMKD